MTRTAEAGRRKRTGVIQLSGYQADGSPDGRNWASDAGTHTVGAPPAPEAAYPTGPGARSAATRSGFGRARSWVIGIGAGLLALAAIYLIDLLLASGEIERGTTIAGVDVGGLTPDEAVAALNAQVLPRYGRPSPSTCTANPSTWIQQTPVWRQTSPAPRPRPMRARPTRSPG